MHAPAGTSLAATQGHQSLRGAVAGERSAGCSLADSLWTGSWCATAGHRMRCMAGAGGHSMGALVGGGCGAGGGLCVRAQQVPTLMFAEAVLPSPLRDYLGM